MICGYGRNGDSTGLVLFRNTTYDTQGRTTMNAESEKIITEADQREPVTSWFYDTRNHIGNVKDSTWYKYDSKGRLVEFTLHSKLNGKRKAVYTYDPLGRCVKAQNYEDGKASSTETFVYDTSGRLNNSSIMEGQKKSSWSTVEYDSLCREVRKILYRQGKEKVTSDTFTTMYSFKSVTKSGKGYASFEKTTTEFTDYDSVSAVYTSRTYSGYSTFLDTIRYVRDSVTHQINWTLKPSKYGSRTIEYVYEDGKLNSTIAKSGDIITEVIQYDTVGHPLRREYYYSGNLKSVSIWNYYATGDLAEYRVLSPEGKLIQREIYMYTYY